MNRNRIDLLLTEHDYGWNKESWFSPLADALENVTAAEAAWKPPHAGNTIWQTVNHLNYYNERLLSQLTGAPGNPGVSTNEETFGEPGDPEDHTGWRETAERTHRIEENLREAIAKLNESDLEDSFIESLAAQIMHDVHHTGQIILIRKMQGSWPAER